MKLKKNKGQLIGQVFIYLITILVVSFILFFGYRAMMTFKEKSEQVSLIQLKNDLQNTVEVLSFDYGSVREKRFVVPETINQVCFVQNYGGMPTLQNTPYPLIEDSVNSGVDSNVFLIAANVEESFYLEKISAPTVLFCVPVIANQITLRMEGRGDHTAIS
jgi:hypothetical protein